MHLAGEPVAQRWTASARRRILDSRVEGTPSLANAAAHASTERSGQRVGHRILWFRGDRILTELSPKGDDFPGEVASAWEREAREAENPGTAWCACGIGTVMGKGGGALQKMLLPFKLGIGGRLGPGTQWMSWIHLEDLCGLILFALRESTLRGVLNAASPHPVTNADFTRAFARAIHRPAFLPRPGVRSEGALRADVGSPAREPACYPGSRGRRRFRVRLSRNRRGANSDSQLGTSSRPHKANLCRRVQLSS